MQQNQIEKLEKKINSELTSKIINSKNEFNELLLETNLEDLIDVLNFLKTNIDCKFRQLIDIAAVDFPENEKRFKIIYLLLSHENNSRIKMSINFEPEKKVPQSQKYFLQQIGWKVFDMYGIKFTNHPDLRRILTDYNFKGHPLRKDFPLTGFNEVRYSEKNKKVIYEPVNLEQKYRDFDFESPWKGTEYIDKISKKDKNTDDKKN